MQEARADAVRRVDKSSLNSEDERKSISITTHRVNFTRPIAPKARAEGWNAYAPVIFVFT